MSHKNRISRDSSRIEAAASRIPERAVRMFGHDTRLASVFVFCHPHCSDLPKTGIQLETVRNRTHKVFNWRALVYWPDALDLRWATTDAVQQIGKIPSLAVTLDRDGKLTREFGVNRSGHVLFYDSQQRLIFSGGIQDSNPDPLSALQPLLDVLNDRPLSAGFPRSTPVSGSPIFGSHNHSG